MRGSMKISHSKAITLSGLTWFGIGVLLIYKGLQFITQAEGKLIDFLASMAGNHQQGALFLVVIALFIGFLKGRFVLSKTVKRVVGHMMTFASPIKVSQMYKKSYFFLIGGMMLLGMTFKYVPIGMDIRGLIDLAVGSALVNGSLLYFKRAVAIRTA